MMLQSEYWYILNILRLNINYLKKIKQNCSMSKINLVPPPLNAAWNNLQNPFSEDVLEYEEAQYEEELRQVDYLIYLN